MAKKDEFIAAPCREPECGNTTIHRSGYCYLHRVRSRSGLTVAEERKLPGPKRKSRHRSRLRTVPDDISQAVGGEHVSAPDYCLSTIKSGNGPDLYVVEPDISNTESPPVLHIGLFNTDASIVDIATVVDSVQRQASEETGETQASEVSLRDGVVLRVECTHNESRKKAEQLAFVLYRPKGREKERIVCDKLPHNTLDRLQNTLRDWTADMQHASEESDAWDYSELQDIRV